MSKRLSSFLSRKKLRSEQEPDHSVDGFLSPNSSSSQYTNATQGSYSNNTTAQNNNGYQPGFVNNQQPYRPVPPIPEESNITAPRTHVNNGSNTLPYPSTPRPNQSNLQYGLDTNPGGPGGYFVRNRTPSNPSPVPSYGSLSNRSPSDYSLISSPQNPSPRQQNMSPTDREAYRISPGPAPIPQFGRPSELPASAAPAAAPAPGGPPYIPLSPQHSFQDGRQQQPQPPRAPPQPPAPAAPRNQHPGEQVPSSHLPKGVNPEKLALQRKHNSSKKSIRQLRQLIREKYRLDVWIWDHRDVLEADRDLIKADYIKADVIMQEIYHIVNHWEEDLFENAEEWRVAKKIKESINKHPEQHKPWNELPPWERSEEVPGEGVETAGPAWENKSELPL